MSFVKQFDPTKKEHVEWLQEIDVSMSKASNQEKYGSVDFMKIVNNNPFGIKMTNPMEWGITFSTLHEVYTSCLPRSSFHSYSRGD